MTELARYYAAACQTDLPCPRHRDEIPARVSFLLGMIDRAVVGYEPFFDVKLVVFPEFAHAAPIYETVAELIDKLAVPIPNEHTDRYARKARERGVYIQTGTFLEVDARWPGSVFNTTCLIGPDGMLSRYRKVNPWLPWEVHASPHDLAGYDEPLFPVVETEIGRLGAAICYDWLFPEAIRRSGPGGRRGLDPRVGLHGPLGRDAAARLVDAFQPGAGGRELRLRRRGQPGSERGELSAVLLARRQHDRRLRRPDPGPGRPRPRREDRRRTDRPGRTAGRAAAPARPSSPFPPAGRCLYWSLRSAHLSSRRSSRLKPA